LLALIARVEASSCCAGGSYRTTPGYTPRVLEAACMSYTLVTGVVVFATRAVQEELERQLVEIAQRREVALEDVTHLREKLFLPRIRFVEISEKDIEDPVSMRRYRWEQAGCEGHEMAVNA
jgi:hypothetical protein